MHVAFLDRRVRLPPNLETQKREGASRFGEYHLPGFLRVQRHADRLRLFANAFERSVGPTVTLRRVVRQDDHVIEVSCIGEIAVSLRESVVQVVQYHVCQERRERRPLRDAPLARAFQELPDEPQHLLVAHPSGHLRQYRRVPDVVEEALQVHVEHNVLLVNQSRTHFVDGVVSRAARPRPERVSREIGFEDRFQQQPEGALDYAVPDRWDRDHADLAALLRNFSSSIRSRAVRVRAQLHCELREEPRSAALLDRLERLTVGPGCAAIALRLQVRRLERRGLHEVYIQPPESMLRGRLRPMAYPLLKFLRCYRGLYHPARLASCTEYPRQGPFAQRALPRVFATTSPSARLSPSPRFALQLARLPCFRRISRRGEEPFSVSTHGLVRVLSPLPRRAAFPRSRFGNRLLPSPILCRLGARSFHLSGPQPVVHHVVTARALASPPSGALSVGFTRGISPAGATQAMRLRLLAASGLSPYGSMSTSRHHIT